MSDRCDHTSVGMLVWQCGKLLMIERRRPPYGIAPPAGHVDQHGSFEHAARDELLEEVGLVADNPNLVLAGARTNPCRRPGGTWHYWRVYEAKGRGILKASTDETKGARWYTLSEIAELLERTKAYEDGRVDENEWQSSPGIEPVWSGIFAELKLVPKNMERAVTASTEDLKWARDYAWNWFDYHATQRNTIFRFYLIFVALLFAGYATLTIEGHYWASIGAATFLAVATSLFMRLDMRNKQLVKLAEDFLKEQEERLSKSFGSKIKFAYRADNEKPHHYIYSFRQIYRTLFVVILAASTLMVVRSAYLILNHASEMRELAATIAVKEIPVVKSETFSPKASQTAQKTMPKPQVQNAH